MRKFLMILAAALLLAGAPVAAQQTNDMARVMRELGGGLDGKELAAAIEKAKAFPLGSKDNPVRADGSGGQRAYLDRLRCDEGKKPTWYRAGSVGEDSFGYIIDDYRVKCPGQPEVSIYIDMYHVWVEDGAVPGFTILPARDAA